MVGGGGGVEISFGENRQHLAVVRFLLSPVSPAGLRHRKTVGVTTHAPLLPSFFSSFFRHASAATSGDVKTGSAGERVHCQSNWSVQF